MIRHAGSKALNNSRNFRCHRKIYCQGGQLFAPNSVILCDLFSTPSMFSALQTLRHFHQGSHIKELKLKSENKCSETDKPKPKKITAPETLSMKEKLKRAVKEYGATVIVFHVGISLISFGTFYLIVSSGVDISSILKFLGLENLIKNNVATNAGTVAIAYAIHKVFAPVRIAITLTSVPFIVRYLRKIGFLKIK